MPLPYHRPRRADSEGGAAFLQVVSSRSDGTFYGGLLVLDARGEPVEFVYTSIKAPGGFLWPETRVSESATLALAHSLFDACVKSPDLLIAPVTLASPEFCLREVAVAIPFVLIEFGEGELPATLRWVNEPPGAGMRAESILQSLAERRFLVEPFSRISAGLREVYPDARWTEHAR